jgi:KDO2-lipid IV(A) lauroyltransferase
MQNPKPRVSHYVESAVARGVIGAAKLLPYSWRVPAIGWLARAVLAPLAGWNRRIRTNLAHVWPDADKALVDRIVAGATDNAGRAIIETWSPEEFAHANRNAPFTGPGVEAMTAARDTDQAVIIVTGHFGNYDALGIVFKAQGFEVGALYKPMTNPIFDKAYVDAIGQFCKELFATDRRGVTQMVRHIKSGGFVAMNLDVHRASGVPIDFLGKPAMTVTTPAEWALKYNALLVPVYAIRQPDGLTFEVFADAPIPHTGDPVQMTQVLCDTLARQIETHPEQWFWIHRRWKTIRKASPASPPQ